MRSPPSRLDRRPSTGNLKSVAWPHPDAGPSRARRLGCEMASGAAGAATAPAPARRRTGRGPSHRAQPCHNPVESLPGYFELSSQPPLRPPPRRALARAYMLPGTPQNLKLLCLKPGHGASVTRARHGHQQSPRCIISIIFAYWKIILHKLHI